MNKTNSNDTNKIKTIDKTLNVNEKRNHKYKINPYPRSIITLNH